MKEQNEMAAEKFSPAPRFRYWFTPPESLAVDVADIEPFVPRENWKAPFPAGLTVEIPAEKIFAKNVPVIALRLLAELLPDHVSPSDGLVKLPAARLAATYRLVEHAEELVPEPPPDPEPPDVAEPVPETAGGSGEMEAGPSAGSATADPSPLPETKPLDDSGSPVEPPAASTPVAAPLPETPAAPAMTPIPPAVDVSIPENPETMSSSPVPAPPEPALEPPPAPPVEIPAPVGPPVVPTKFPLRRLGLFVGLPLFRRRPPAPARQPIAPPTGPVPVEPPPAEPPLENPDSVLPKITIPPPVPLAPAEPPVAETADVPQPEPQPEPQPDISQPPAVPVRMLQTEHLPGRKQGQEIVGQEPLQALFMTEEILTVSRVIELCGGLPGVNSCVLAHGSVVVASHNVPDAVDLVSMSAHAADMLRAMRDSSARMGVGTVPAVTLHTEKGVISFFNREDLTMLVFHRDRGFVPGVREKMAAVLGELTKARLTLPVGGDEEF